MVTHVMVPAYDASAPASLSPVLVDQVLRGQLGYQRVVIIDAMDAAGLQQFMQQQGYKDPAQAIAEASVQAILAGDDIVECPIEPDRLSAVVSCDGCCSIRVYLPGSLTPVATSYYRAQGAYGFDHATVVNL